MPRPKKTVCQVCSAADSKYTCSKCTVLYCSVPCYKRHQESSCAPQTAAHASICVLEHGARQDLIPSSEPPEGDADSTTEVIPTDPPLRALTTLKWPYIPDESAYADPLKRDDPKTLQLHQYEAIATSPAIRAVLAEHPQLPALLTSLDKLRGGAREDALQRALGVSEFDPTRHIYNDALAGMTEEDVQSLRRFAEAIEAAVRGGKVDVLGLDWGDQLPYPS